MSKIKIVLVLVCVASFGLISCRGNWVSISKRTFLMGSTFPFNIGNDGKGLGDEEDDQVVYTSHEVLIDEYQIGKYPVTIGSFVRFIDATGYELFPYEKWDTVKKTTRDIKNDNYPMLCDYFHALAYCYWFSKQSGETVRLPTEAEWELAATGGKAQIYPWGNEYSPIKKEDHPVGAFKQDVSPLGVWDTYSNSDEMFLDLFDTKYYSQSPRENPLSMLSTVRSNVGDDFPYRFAATSRSIVNDLLFPLGVLGVRTPAMDDCEFRLVRENGKAPKVFNKGTEYEANYELVPCRVAVSMPLYFDRNLTKKMSMCPQNSQGWILFRSTSDKKNIFIVVRFIDATLGREDALAWKTYWGWCDKGEVTELASIPNWRKYAQLK